VKVASLQKGREEGFPTSDEAKKDQVNLSKKKKKEKKKPTKKNKGVFRLRLVGRTKKISRAGGTVQKARYGLVRSIKREENGCLSGPRKFGLKKKRSR